MAASIPDQFKDLLTKRAFAHLATLMPDGTPQVSPVWFDFDGSHFIVNSARGRVKDKNMRRNKHVALSIVDPDNAYRHMDVQGAVVDITEQGADAHIDKMAKKYLGKDKYPFAAPGEVRVTYKIQPNKLTTMG